MGKRKGEGEGREKGNGEGKRKEEVERGREEEYLLLFFPWNFHGVHLNIQ